MIAVLLILCILVIVFGVAFYTELQSMKKIIDSLDWKLNKLDEIDSEVCDIQDDVRSVKYSINDLNEEHKSKTKSI